MDTHEIYMAAPLSDLAEEVSHPLDLPDDGGTADLGSSARERENLLHEEFCRIKWVHVSLAADIWLVKSHEVAGWVLVEAGFALIPFVPIFGSPKHRDEFDVAGHCADGTILPVWGNAQVSKPPYEPFFHRYEKDVEEKGKRSRRYHSRY
jgi:hypothetical protein